MLLPGLLENEKSCKKRVSGCNSVAEKVWKFSKTLRLHYPFLVGSSKLSPALHMSRSYISVYESGLFVPHTMAVSQNGIYHVYFFFILKYLCNLLWYIPWICSSLICFKVQMTLRVHLGLHKSMKSSYIWT